jgi:hypothetical protein
MAATPFHSAEPREITLTVTPDGMVSIVGTVRSSDDQEIPNVAVKVVGAMLGPNDHNYGSQRIELSGRQEFPGEANGSFVLPGKVPRSGKYSATISAPGFMAVETPFLAPPSSGPVLDLGVTRLTRARVATGIIRDSSGAPVAGAEVWSWAAPTDGGRSYQGKSKSRTDSNGRFKLDKLHPLSPLLFASKKEYRLTGCALPSDSAEVAVTLFRTDETIPEEHTVQPAPLDNTVRHAAATRMLESVLGVQRNSSYFHGEILSILVKSDANVARQELGKTTSPAARAETLARLGEIQDAVAEVEGVSDAYSRAHCRLEMADALDDADVIRELLAAALLDAQAIAQPDRRVAVVAGIVDRFARLGDEAQVAKILREEQSRAEALSTAEWPGYARGLFAAQLARTDPQTALRIASEAAADDQARHYQNIAHVVAASNPAAAEEALSRIGKHLYVDDPAVRVAFRMAPVDLPRAIRLVEQIDTSQFRHTEKTRGLGVIAWAIRNMDPQRARDLLRRAFALVPEQHGGSGSRSDDVFGTSLTLLQFAEEVDPEHLTDYFWLTASLHAGPTGAGWTPDDAPREDAERQSHLVLLFARYDAAPELARRIMAPVFDYWDGQIGTKSHHFTDHEGTFMAMAQTDPQRAADWAVRFHEKLEAEDRRYIPQPWEIIGRALTDDRDSIGKSVTRQVFHRWVIDQFDP